MADNFSVAWRTLDAQYWGVPQRRRRIFLVADFDGDRAGKILFEREGLRGSDPKSHEQGEGAPENAKGGVGGSAVIGGAIGCLTPWDAQDHRIYNTTAYPNISKTLQAGNGHMSVSDGVPNCVVTSSAQVFNESGRGYWMDGFGCLRAEGENRESRPGHVVAMLSANEGAEDRESLAVVYDTTSITNPQNRSNPKKGDPCPTLQAKQHPPLVIALQGNAIDRADTAGCNGAGWKEDVSYTLNTIDRHAIAFDCRNMKEAGKSSTLQGKDSLNFINPVCYSIGNGQANQLNLSEKARALDCMHDQQALVYASETVKRKYIVRRLTPMECSRLQGFPDGWGIPRQISDISDEEFDFWQQVRKTYMLYNKKKWKPLETKDMMMRWYNALHTDSSEYTMWGNGVALPCVKFVLEGILLEHKKSTGGHQ